MASLLVLKALGADDAHSPEFQYLISHCLLEAREVFDRVELALAGEGPEPPDRTFDAVLRLSSNVLLCRRSIAALRDRLDAGAQEVRPYRLADVGSSAPVYTLRGFELAERAFLERGPTEAVTPPALSPAALLSFDRFRNGSAEQPVAYAGLCHEFIDYYGEVRSDVLPFVPAGAREVLEVG